MEEIKLTLKKHVNKLASLSKRDDGFQSDECKQTMEILRNDHKKLIKLMQPIGEEQKE